MKKKIALLMAAAMVWTSVPGLAEDDIQDEWILADEADDTEITDDEIDLNDYAGESDVPAPEASVLSPEDWNIEDVLIDEEWTDQVPDAAEIEKETATEEELLIEEEENERDETMELAAEAPDLLPITKEYFPDAVFRKTLLEGSYYIWDKDDGTADDSYREYCYDPDRDGYLSKEERTRITKLSFDRYGELADLKGIEYFPELTYLEFGYTKVTSLDVSHNPKLEHLDCVGNFLTSLDLNNNLNLRVLYCSENNLESLDVRNNAQLQVLYCEENRLTSLDVSHNPKLKEFNCQLNHIASLDVSNSPELWWFYCSANCLMKLDLGNNSKIVSGDGGVYGGNHVDISSSRLVQIDGKWCFNIAYFIGQENIHKVKLKTEGAFLDNGMVIFSGTARPETLSYVYDTQSPFPEGDIMSTWMSVALSFTDNGIGKHTQHIWDRGEVTKPATCTSAGIKKYTCVECGGIKKETILAAGHIYGNWQKVSEATVFSAEVQQRTCSVCKQAEKRSVGSKLAPTIKVNATTVPLKVKQSTSKLEVSGLAKGDYVKSWKSSDTKIVQVDSKGKLTAQNKVGKATVTVTLASGLTQKIAVNVQKRAVATTGIGGITSKVTLEKGKKITLKPVITPFTSLNKVTFKSSNKKVATVTSSGVVTAKKEGTAKITIKSGKKKVTVTVTVPKIAVKEIKNVPASLTIKKKKSTTLKPKLTPSNSKEKITYTSSNKKVATVNKKGKIVGKRAGTAVITVKAGKIAVKCVVTVK